MELSAGTYIADRFEIVARAGAGGMGVLYRAVDRRTGEPVAIKMLHAHAEGMARRFAREAWVLSDLRHPAIVGYVDHGQTRDGRVYLAMQWLDGEDLATRLDRGPLEPAEAVTLMRRVADGIAAAHARGVVHRDLKPSNLFLAGGRLEAASILDFGLARLRDELSVLTAEGTLMGTPGYMAPEQVRCEGGVGPAADVFALGCVLYKCIAGRSPFAADRPWARMAKVLFEEPPPLWASRADVPPALDDLVARMLVKAPRDRIASGAELVRELAALDMTPGSGPRQAATGAITRDEIRLVSVVVAAAPPPPTPTGHGDPDATLTRGADDASAAGDRGARLHQLAALHGGRLEQLPQGLAIAAILGRGTATDAAVQAARCAREMRALLPTARIVVTTGRAAFSGNWPVGTTIDRAADLLGDPAGDSDDDSILVDPSTAGLLDARFEIARTTGGLVLGAEHQNPRGRTLLGRPSPFVGRDRELATLEAIVDEGFDEPAPRAVLVTGEAGIGKSRLWHEVVLRGRARRTDVELWICRGDPTSAGSSFGLVAQAVRRAAGIRDTASADERRDAIRGLVARHVPVADRDRVMVFLAELVGAPFPDGGDSAADGGLAGHRTQQAAPAACRDQLAAARQDPLRMGDQLRRAWEELVRAHAADHPLIIAVEDLHWGDVPSVRLLDAALRHAAGQPLAVVALARPEVHRLFPDLWRSHQRDELALGRLPRRGAVRLARAALGDRLDDAAIDRLVSRADGNAFYLEELIRAAAEGRDAAPDTVVAMVQARLDALDPDLRRVLRAASVFGQSCRARALAAVLGTPVGGRDLSRWLDELVRRELLAERGAGDPAHGAHYLFRHALVRDAAYQSLTPADRTLAHRLAAGWLEVHDPSVDPLALAEHHERGGEPARAVAWFQRAAEQALEGNDFAAALAGAERGRRAGAAGEDLGRLAFVATQACIWLGKLAEARQTSEEALASLPRGTAMRYRALGRHVWLLAQQRDGGGIADALAELHVAGDDRGAEAARFIALCQATSEALLAELRDASDDIVAAVDAMFDASVPENRTARPWRALLAGVHAACRGARHDTRDHFRRAIEAFDAIGDRRLACLNRSNVGFMSTELGEVAEAEVMLRRALADAESMGLPGTIASLRHNLGITVARAVRLEEATAILEQALGELRAQGYRSLEATAQVYLAQVLHARGLLIDAEAHARRACEMLDAVPAQRPYAEATLARVLLSTGRANDALALSSRAMDAVGAGNQLAEGDLFVRHTHATCLLEAGCRTEAAEIAADARRRVLAAAEGLTGVQRERFLRAVPEHAAVLDLAATVCGPVPDE